MTVLRQSKISFSNVLDYAKREGKVVGMCSVIKGAASDMRYFVGVSSVRV